MLQTAAVRTDSHDDWATVLSGGNPGLEVHGTNDVCLGPIDISGALTDKMYARLGLGVLMTSPGAWSAVTGTPTWDATTFETTSNDLTPSTSGKMWLQLGVGATLSSGTTPTTAMATVSAAARRV